MPGSHSTAVRRIDGKVTVAEKGTLFLDEIGDLAPTAGEVPAAAAVAPVLPRRNASGRRRRSRDRRDQRRPQRRRRGEALPRDLFYRLNVLSLRMPSLSERRDDIAELAAFFSATASGRHGLPKLDLSSNALRAAELADWPGNIRQLANAVEARRSVRPATVAPHRGAPSFPGIGW